MSYIVILGLLAPSQDFTVLLFVPGLIYLMLYTVFCNCVQDVFYLSQFALLSKVFPWTLYRTSSFVMLSTQWIFSIFLKTHVSKATSLSLSASMQYVRIAVFMLKLCFWVVCIQVNEARDDCCD